MRPVDPGSDYGELVAIAEDQPQFATLVARIAQTQDGRQVLTRWQFSDEERKAIAAGADLLLGVLTDGNPLQPLALSIAGVETPLESMAYTRPGESPVSESMAFKPEDQR